MLKSFLYHFYSRHHLPQQFFSYTTRIMERQCQIISSTDEGIQQAATMLQAGKCVAFPTETVYGLGANALDIDAVLRIFQYKGRPLTDPLIVHVPDITSARELFSFPTFPITSSSTSSTSSTTEIVTPEKIFHSLGETFWPGPLTIVAKGITTIPDKVMANTGYVGVRVPANSIARRLLQATKLPIAAPSANRFGHVSPTKASHVIDDLGHHPIGVVLSEDDQISNSSSTTSSASTIPQSPLEATAAIGIESTVVKIDIEPLSKDNNDEYIVALTVLRRGGVSIQEIEHCLYTKYKYNKEHVKIQVKSSAGIVPLTDLPTGIYTHTSTLSSSTSENTHTSIVKSEEIKTNESVGMEAPGMLLTHYAPDIETFLITNIIHQSTSPSSTANTSSFTLFHKDFDKTIEIDPKTTIIIDFGGQLNSLKNQCIGYNDLSPTSSIMEARRIIFDQLRWSETIPNAKAVLLVDPVHLSLASLPESPDKNTELQHGDALRDRMYRAASGKEVTLILQ